MTTPKISKNTHPIGSFELRGRSHESGTGLYGASSASAASASTSAATTRGCGVSVVGEVVGVLVDDLADPPLGAPRGKEAVPARATPHQTFDDDDDDDKALLIHGLVD